MDVMADILSPAGVVAFLAISVAFAGAVLEWLEQSKARRRFKALNDEARGLRMELKSKEGETEQLRSDSVLANQNVQYFYDKLCLDALGSDDQKKRFLEAAGVFARSGEIAPLLEVKDVDLNHALGVSADELSDLMTFRNHLDQAWLARPAWASTSLEVVGARVDAVSKMEAIWGDRAALVEDIRPLLASNLWVFEPDFVG
ncbi:MAG TPA: hypothetical protein DCL54_09275, partial [Alphaproteobacteria bacterium]|nr:hypothetical protein [Alphaproteobacteria bacterium]